VELLKLPLAVWTASRHGWQKWMMITMGLPLMCLLTFQLVKDMAVYEMGVAMTPPSQMLEQAANEEIKITQLSGELAAIEGKKADRDRKLAELAGKKAKAKADLEESRKFNDDARQDAITLTDYQKKELSDVEARQATIIKQFDADTAQLTKAIADLHAQRETEVGRATQWNAEEARIENAYKAKMAAYTNKKAAYDKEKAEYDNANFLKRQLMKEPVALGVPPERESNTVLKPTLVAEIDAQIKTKEAELLTVNNKRRDRVAQVDADARRLREDFDRRSGT
jgi:DNA repair exonuclease SbcCD ATPase subunit